MFYWGFANRIQWYIQWAACASRHPHSQFLGRSCWRRRCNVTVILLAGEPLGNEPERGGRLVLWHHMAAAPDREEVEVALVPRHVSPHALLSVQCPGPPWLLLLEPESHGPVLRDETVDTRVSVAVVNQDTCVSVVRQVLVKRHQIGLGK